MKATIWHNPNCSTSRKTLDLLRAEPGLDVEVIQYLKTPPTREKLAALYARAGLSPRQGLRRRDPLFAGLNLADADDATALDAMVAHPVLIERPLVETEKGVVLARPIEKVQEIL
jgi:arsenate reductase